MRTLPMYVVYARPRDYPNEYVVRIHHIGPYGVAPEKDLFMISTSLQMVRDEMVKRGLSRLERDPEDDPVILETWL